MSELDLLALLGEHDDALRRIERSLARGEQRLTDRRAELDAARTRHRTLLEEQREAGKQEQALQGRLDLYTQRRDRATQALETGAGDPFAAERQVAQCAAILDETEDTLLGVLDQQDARTEAIAQVLAQIAALEATLAVEAAEVGAEATVLGAEAETHGSARAAVLDQLPADVQVRYAQLRQRRGTAVARVDREACSGCQRVVHQQHMADLRRGIVRPCGGCGRWLIP